MARYSIAQDNNEFGSLLDRALAGEKVIVSQGDKPPVELRVVAAAAEGRMTPDNWADKLRQLHASMPMGGDSAELIRQMRDEGS